MPTTVQDILDILEHLAPQRLAEDWDNTGLLLGNPYQPVKGVLLALDPSPEVIDQARKLGANLIITHHPLIFHPLKAIRSDLVPGQMIQQALSADIALIGCHTNLDAAPGGVNDVLASRLGLTEVVPLVSRPQDDGQASSGMGRIGWLPEAMPASRFVEFLKDRCALPWLLTTSPKPDRVRKIALCAGSGSELAEAAWQAGADAFVTAEVKHSVARWAEATGLWLLDGGHFSTENLVIPILREKLEVSMQTTGGSLPIHCAEQLPPLQLA